MRKYLWGFAALLGLASVTALLAQTVDGIDVQAIKQRSADLQADAEAVSYTHLTLPTIHLV